MTFSTLKRAALAGVDDHEPHVRAGGAPGGAGLGDGLGGLLGGGDGLLGGLFHVGVRFQVKGGGLSFPLSALAAIAI